MNVVRPYTYIGPKDPDYIRHKKYSLMVRNKLFSRKIKVMRVHGFENHVYIGTERIYKNKEEFEKSWK